MVPFADPRPDPVPCAVPAPLTTAQSAAAMPSVIVPVRPFVIMFLLSVGQYAIACPRVAGPAGIGPCVWTMRRRS
jgi:hypothetical protein